MWMPLGPTHQFQSFRHSTAHSVTYYNTSMPGVVSATGLIAARVRPIYKAKKKKVELYGSAKPAPFILRPFAGFLNPYPYGCSVLCNHPADYETKEVVRRAKESWATEGKALLLPVEMEMIRGGSVPARDGPGVEGKEEESRMPAAAGVCGGGGADEPGGEASGAEAASVPEELFRRYTDTDSRPLTPAPTLASGPAHACRPAPRNSTPREKTTLVLDLRTNQRDQESDILSWRALTLEQPPSSSRTKIYVPKPVPRNSSLSTAVPPPSPTLLLPQIPINDAVPQSTDEYDDSTSEEVHSKRKGKRRKKRKYRRGSTYGQQAEVRDPPEPSETLVSQNKNDSRRTSIKSSANESRIQYLNKTPEFTTDAVISSSFIASDVLKHLCRDLDREMIEWEFSLKRKVALEEALRVKKEMQVTIRGSRQISAQTVPQNVPRVFSRQSARFEILDSQSLKKLTPLDYLSKHVFVTDSRKLIFSRVFNKFNEDSYEGGRYMLPQHVFEALEDVLGKSLTEEQVTFLTDILGTITRSLDFRTWCGICSFVERALPTLPNREVDPPDWVEWADFETLERRLKSVCQADPKLIKMLRIIRDR